MRTAALLLSSLFALVGCQPSAGPEVKPTQHSPAFHLTVTFMTVAEAAKKCSSYGVNENVRNNVARGCALYFHESNRCEVYTPTPTNLDDENTRILGHEVLHCVSGRYHE